jgi:hypothetical protein
MWLRADALSLNNGDLVSAWADSGPNANNAAQATSANRPTYVASSSLNAMPALQFSGGTDNSTSDFMTVADDDLLDNSAGLTFYAAVRTGTLGTPDVQAIYGKRISSSTTSEWAYTWFLWTSNYFNLDLNTQNDRFSTSPTAYSSSTNYLFSLIYDGTLASGSRAKLYTNGGLTKTSTETSTSIINSNQNLYIGTMNASYGKYFGGHMAELMIMNSALTEAQRIIVDNYLSAKYGLTLSSNDLYTMDNSGNGNFDFDVAGIGQASDASNNTDARGTGIVRVSSASGLANNEWLFWGHNNAPLTSYHVTDLPTGIEARLERVWRVSETGDVGTVTMSFDLSGVAGAKTTSDLRLLLDTDNDGVFSDETVGGGGVISGASDLGGSVYQWTGISLSDGLRFTIGSVDSAQTPLPVELLKFEAIAQPEENSVYLIWVTASERNNHFFTVEKSKNLETFEEVAQVEGAGNSQTQQTYETTDYAPFPGVSYYRLSQTDFDNQSHVFPLKTVHFESTEEVQLSLYPNPLSKGDQLFIRLPGNAEQEVDLMVNDMIGREQITDMASYNEGNSRVLVIEFKERLKSGIYFVNVDFGGETKTYKVQVR